VVDDTSKPADRCQILDAIENAFKAGYKWEAVDTETDNVRGHTHDCLDEN
jgi:hypothetical protein